MKQSSVLGRVLALWWEIQTQLCCYWLKQPVSRGQTITIVLISDDAIILILHSLYLPVCFQCFTDNSVVVVVTLGTHYCTSVENNVLRKHNCSYRVLCILVSCTFPN